ncbi:hypothetical protein Sango_2774500 [Sesamum angolense]|uniref:Uncharacterized protein n=1 Tax=Sesamum angolense TaxID=2727404 RepID=A0AAE1T7Q5_9LAMI|nr:hypothetical protein Sango_2774500 [Sesamum angolense]
MSWHTLIAPASGFLYLDITLSSLFPVDIRIVGSIWFTKDALVTSKYFQPSYLGIGLVAYDIVKSSNFLLTSPREDEVRGTKDKSTSLPVVARCLG